jgi:type IV pilus assembly protein PilQ
MEVEVTKDSVGETTFNGVPTINTNKVNTQVLVENGGTVVIGGVYAQTDTTDVSKVPLLGDVPVLGVLFRRTLRTDDKTELLIFITPKIMTDALSLR